MEAFDMRRLRRAVGVCEPHLDAARVQFRRIVLRIRTEALYQVRVAEFCTVVGEDCGEKLAEKLYASLLPEHVEDSGAGIRSFPFSQETESKRAFREDYREEHLPLTDPMTVSSSHGTTFSKIPNSIASQRRKRSPFSTIC